MVCIKFSHIKKKFKNLNGDFFYPLKDVSFSINKNQLNIIAGKNGSGKSLLMKIATGLVKQDSGEVEISNLQDNAKKIGLVFQNAYDSILADTPLDDVLLSLHIKDSKIKEPVRIAENLLERVGILEKKNHPSFALSAGESRRLLVASCMALESQVIFFDEPYSNLDFQGIKSINKFIIQLMSNGRTIVIITHELEKCLAMAQKIIILSEGRVVFEGCPENSINLLENYGVRNPLVGGLKMEDLVWK